MKILPKRPDLDPPWTPPSPPGRECYRGSLYSARAGGGRTGFAGAVEVLGPRLEGVREAEGEIAEGDEDVGPERGVPRVRVAQQREEQLQVLLAERRVNRLPPSTAPPAPARSKLIEDPRPPAAP